MAARKHAEIIKAWADGVEIECRQRLGPGGWTDWCVPADGSVPAWDATEYRIKPIAPEVEYPVTRMSDNEIYDEIAGADPMMAFQLKPNMLHTHRAIANAALRHAIDAQQVVRMAEVQEIASQLGKEKRAARDMAVAEQVRTACISAAIDGPSALDLASVIRRSGLDNCWLDVK
ncbi:hypothetical protein HF313_15045 [Massilia atriviolacea]|uniref:Uncharacterized protein n=1 Tax=Massilia atriviolacea TaxID=2495579 RepID=A0A430HRC6_9BURK|nr:hypothetical protein [Massilia atriviolacea]RSZ60029.1 hypothetical protein EJB06_07570 [Massilia atriviolacea]